ncbi:hypothetical protein [Breoghania sp.]|uniref:hypothetical protein n=1 Tax=Breoghania sp. TaxID=2065378 RepID=UPI00261D5A22|nr:hypothetical protein [Breoghania sp.]MDJ0933038.1 hypothetical protein [Breoghania sp.]
MKSLVAVLLSLILSAPLAVERLHAEELATPTGKTLLVVRGNITRTNHENTARFDLAMLKALPGHTSTIQTPWTQGLVTFEGPFLRAVFDSVGASGSKFVISALNDYSAEVPLSDAYDFDTVLALKKNGKYMGVRDKGPVFFIYTFDKTTSLYNEKYFVRSVWQIREIEVVR